MQENEEFVFNIYIRIYLSKGPILIDV